MKNYNRIRTIRLSDEVWRRLEDIKDEQETWDKTFELLLNKLEEYESNNITTR